MKSIWILAAAGEEIESSEITSDVANQAENIETSTLEDGSNTSTPEETAPPTLSQKLGPFWIFIPVLLLMYFVMFRGPKKKQQEQQKMVQNLQKNDRVRTIGGILGTIIEVKENEITIKIDESNNTKMKILPAAVAKVLSADDKQ